ncbi:hypothetical protein F8388_012084 [Cannabis sativa]|uniref:Transcription repressor n=1 Tax=Cannabis sativa TaxID=3483 RepID=A0A7J6GEB4_CANSA|nr:hypothetical protein G4B88_000113 [Cannabis sativa]KAF4381162.1 hypothetical protein F8388_012084 [Cannabis sativa]
MSSNKSKNPLRTIFATNGGCGCAKLKLCDVLEPIRKPKIQAQKSPSNNNNKRLSIINTSSTSSYGVVSILSEYDNENEKENSSATTTTTNVENTSSSFSVETENSSKCSSSSSRSKRLNDTCIAVVKETNDPYYDFKQSMKQMIVEKEIYDNQDLKELLTCFLDLNSPSHGDVIVRAFTEIRNDVVPKNKNAECLLLQQKKEKEEEEEEEEEDIQSSS